MFTVDTDEIQDPNLALFMQEIALGLPRGNLA